MKDSISEDDIRQALREQLEFIEKDDVPVSKPKKKKRKAKSKADDSQDKKRKLSRPVKLNDEVSLSIENRDTQRPPRPPPRVIVFEEPGKSKQKNTSHNSSKLRDKSTEDSEDLDFLEIARDVKEFGMTGFSKKERRKYEQQKAQALGAKAPKGAKMPYNILIAHQKKQKQKEMTSLKLEKAMGMSTKKSKNKSKKKENPTSSIGWWSDKSSKGLDASIGRYKKGVQMLSQSDIRKIKQRTK